MEPDFYKDFKTSRGFTYHYYICPSRDKKPTILFCHGFPSTSYDWHVQIDFFQPKGYGIIVPDMLGYGGTDKPTTAESYAMPLIVDDIAEIVKHEKVDNVVAVGHDWGSVTVSRLANLHADRFIGFAFLTASYLPPDPTFDHAKLAPYFIKHFGYFLYGYWEFFCEGSADRILREHIDSFYDIFVPADPKLWITDWAPTGKLKDWCLNDKRTTPAAYFSKEREIQKENILKGGFAAPFCWYKAYFFGITPKKDAEIPKENYTIKKPVFYGATLQDYVCLPVIGKAAIHQFCPKATVVDFDTAHWVQFAEPDKVNKELSAWIDGILEKAE